MVGIRKVDAVRLMNIMLHITPREPDDCIALLTREDKDTISFTLCTGSGCTHLEGTVGDIFDEMKDIGYLDADVSPRIIGRK